MQRKQSGAQRIGAISSSGSSASDAALPLCRSTRSRSRRARRSLPRAPTAEWPPLQTTQVRRRGSAQCPSPPRSLRRTPPRASTSLTRSSTTVTTARAKRSPPFDSLPPPLACV
eukprot:Amastigsp_a184494_28.p5 type:complete len:114 gc:universal Amastigsp_a184494_28:357-16(-)